MTPTTPTNVHPLTRTAKLERIARALRERAGTARSGLPLAHGQQALWFLHRSAPESAAYHVAFSVRIRSALDVDALRRAAQALVDRHPLLRAVFRLHDGRPVQDIRPQCEVAFEIENAAGLDEAALALRVRATYERPFDLERGPLFRVALFRRGEHDHVLLLSVHHIVFDGWSLWLVLDELRQLYAAESRGERAALPLLAVDYASWVARQERLLAGPGGEAHWAFWQHELAGDLPVLDLPTDRPRPAAQRFRGATRAMTLDPELTSALRQLAQRSNVTLFALLLAAYQVLLHRWTGQDTVLVGCPTAGRESPALAGVVGYFVNPVVMRADLSQNLPFERFLQQVWGTALRALEHQAFPFPLLVQRLRPRREAGHSPIFQASFVLQQPQRSSAALHLLAHGESTGAAEWAGLAVEPFELAQQEGQFDVELELIEIAGCLRAAFKYDSDLFDASTIERMASHYGVLLRGIAANPACAVRRLPLMTDVERAAHRPHQRARAAAAAQPRLCLHQAFEAQARLRPDAEAVRCGAEALSYAELDARAEQLARCLRALGAGPEVRVGLFVERSCALIVGLLGIAKAGAAYVPIDPASPPARASFILEDSRVAALVTQESLATRLPATGCPVLRLDADWPRIAQADATPAAQPSAPAHLAYVIYTSGSTGVPKGVQITHHNVMRLFQATDAWFGFNERDVWSLFHSIAFDFSVWEIWGALLYGGRVVVVPHDVSRSPREFLELLEREQVTVLNQTPSAFRQLVQADERAQPASPLALRLVIFGGEALDLPSLRPWFERHGEASPRLVNMYGITETTVHVTYRPLCASDVERPRSVIGVPIPDLDVHLLDADREPVPVGLTGEIWVSGEGLSRGYLDRPELDRERFVWHRFPGGEQPVRLYRSGDLGRRLPDGELEYLGRCDDQVKIRGFRIEPGEIEAALGACPGVRSATVVVASDARGDKSLVACVVPDDPATLSTDALRSQLRARLPGYMVPSRIAVIDALPLTGNGKVDRAALLARTAEVREPPRALVPPRDALERRLAAIWERVLDVRPLGVRDAFFDCGGHSALAVYLMAEIEKELGAVLPIAALFQHPTVEALAGLLRERTPSEVFSPLVPIQPGGSLPPLFFVAGGGGSVLCFHGLAQHLGADRPFFGLQAIGLDGDCEPLDRIESIAERYVAEIRRVQARGPYHLGGHCFGGLVAFETAQQLERAGETVALVALLDVPAPGHALAAALDAIDESAWLARLAGVMGEAVGDDLGLCEAALRELDPEARMRCLGERMQAAGLLPPGAPLRQVRGLVSVFMASSRARYAPRNPVAVPLALFRAGTPHSDYDYSRADDPGCSRETSTLGWHALAGGPVSVDVAPGTHVTLLSEPHVRVLAQKLSARLRTAGAARSSAA